MNGDALALLEQQIRNCTLCGLYQTRNKAVAGGGNPDGKILLIGEAPGYEEDKTGKVFVGKSGQLLDKILSACNFSREKEVYISNVVKCRPPGNRTPSPQEQKSCLPYLVKQMEIIKPAIIVTLGATPLKALFGNEMRITKQRGQWLYWKNGIPVMPTYHPSALLRNPALKHQTWEDFKKIIIKYRELVDAGHYCQYI
jgi:DNA polymerase